MFDGRRISEASVLEALPLRHIGLVDCAFVLLLNAVLVWRRVRGTYRAVV